MNEEEKQAIEILRNFEPDDLVECSIYIRAVEKITNLIDKQQKEIEKCEYYKDHADLFLEENKKLKKEIENRLKEIKGLYKLISVRDERIDRLIEINIKFKENWISKDKIKEKIEEITSYAYTSAEERDCQDYAIQSLKELLGE